MRSVIVKVALATATAAAATAIFAGSALADPPASHTPALTDVVGVGSDTIQFAMNDVTAAYDATTPAPAGFADSFDAVNPSTGAAHEAITTKPGCSVTRPNGSSEGITALQADQLSTTDGTTPCVDYARSSRARVAATDGGTTFLPFAQDGVDYATSTPTTSFPTTPVTHAPQNLTTADLATIYSCGDTGVTSVWTDFGGTSSDAVQAVIPQPGSGTRSFFEGAIGVSDQTIIDGISSGCLTQVEEHDPAPIRANADRIGPFSVARFNSVANDAGIQLNSSGFSAQRIVYNVVRGNGTTVPANLQGLLGDGTAANAGFICSAAGQAIVQNTDGFAPITLAGHTCGVHE
jgi:ABC-type phosphate transport system substrate-binding protein